MIMRSHELSDVLCGTDGNGKFITTMSWRQWSWILVVVASGETPCLMFRKHINDLNHEEKEFLKVKRI